MKSSFAAPRRIRRVAARRVFHKADNKSRQVVLTIGVPQRVPGSDWGCPIQITGLGRRFSRPQFIFGIDGVQALHLAMQWAGAVLGAAGRQLVWLGEPGDLGMPRFLPEVPRPMQRRIDAAVERELRHYVRAAARRMKQKGRGPG